MSNLSSLEFLMIKQTCRFFAYKFEMGSNQSPEDPSNIYSFEFLKALYDRPRDNINKIIRAALVTNDNENVEIEATNENEKYNFIEKRILLDFFKKVVDMKSQSAKQWTDLQHYLCFVYRYCMTSDPDPEQEILSPYFIADMRSIVCSLMEEDQIQLCLRLFSLVREYTVFAHKQHQKITNVEASIEKLEKLLINTYKLGWLDFNTSIFMYYFYETTYVQNVVHEFEQMKDNVSIKAAGIYTVLTELHKLWRSQMLGINGVIANKLGAKFKGLDNKMMSSHKRILSKNFWIDRTSEEKAMQDIRLFDCQLFTLVGRALAELDGNNCKNLSRIISENIDIVKLGMSTNSNPKNSRRHTSHSQFDTSNSFISNPNSLKRHQNSNGEISKDPSPKLANEPPVFKNDLIDDDDDDADVTKMAFPELEVTKMSRKTFYNFLKYRNSLPRTDKENKCEQSTKVPDRPTLSQNMLRIRLNQRNENVSSNVASKNNAKLNTNTTNNKISVNKAESPAGPSKNNHPVSETTTPTSNDDLNTNPLINDIHGLLNYIEGNTNIDKLALAEKKAAKKARQRHKKEQEKMRLEEEERKKEEEEKRKAEERLRNEELARQLAEKAAKNSKKESKKQKKKNKCKEETNSELMEETIPAMVTIKRVVENDNSLPTVTITLKGSTPDQDKLLYTLVNGHDGNEAQLAENKKNKKNKSQQDHVGKTVNLEVNAATNTKKKKNKNDKPIQSNNTVITKELRVTLAVDPVNNVNTSADAKKNKQNGNINMNKQGDTKINSKKTDVKKDKSSKEADINIPMLKLPPGITITKVDGPMTDRNYKTSNIENPPYNSNIPVSKSGVIVVDTEKLIKQSSVTSINGTTAASKKNRRKRNKKQRELQNGVQAVPTSNKPSMVTLKNPIFQNMQNNRHEPEMIPDLGGGQCQQAAIFKNENGMVTIRSSRLQQSLNSGSPMPNLLPDLKPVLGPEVPTTYMSSCNFSEFSRISPFNAQEILSGLPGIEITKVDKNSTKNDLDNKKSCHTAEVSIIPANNSDKFNFDKDDLHYDNVFTPKDILEDDMDADERELEAFKRFCQQSVPPKRKEKVAHLNVKDIVLKKKNDKVSA
ncbi:uncharacterized protein BDFB_000175, partial [Asbolus verrucosus]